MDYFGFPSRFNLILIGFLMGLGLFLKSDTSSGIVTLCKTREN